MRWLQITLSSHDLLASQGVTLTLIRTMGIMAGKALLEEAKVIKLLF